MQTVHKNKALVGIEARTNTWTSVVMFLIAVALLTYAIVTRPTSAEGRAEADKIFRDDYVADADSGDSSAVSDIAAKSDNVVATSDDGDTSNPRT